MKEVLADIAIYTAKGPYKNLYMLKPEYQYRNTPTSFERIAPETSSMADGSNADESDNADDGKSTEARDDIIADDEDDDDDVDFDEDFDDFDEEGRPIKLQ